MAYVSLTEAASLTGRTKRQIRLDFEKGARKRRPSPQRRDQYLYEVKSNEHVATASPPIEEPQEEAQSQAASPPSGSGGIWEIPEDQEGRAYFYNRNTRNYVFPHVPKNIVVSADIVQSMVEAYSNTAGGKGATLNQLAREFKMTRAVIKKIFRCLGKTHDSLGKTDEAIAETPEDELVEDFTRAKEQRVLQKALHQQYEHTKKLAAEAENWDQFVFDRFKRLPMPTIQSPPKLPAKVSPGTEVISVMATPTDLHYGASSWVGETGEHYSREICRERLLDTAATMVARVRRFGAPTQFLLGAGGDWFHIDGFDGTTTKGTRLQGIDGTFPQIMTEGFALAAEYIEYLRQAAPVHILYQGGNHDRSLSMSLIQWLRVLYKDQSDVEVRSNVQPRQYLELKNTLVGVTHGDGCKVDKLPGLMAAEAREAWGRTRHHVWFTGHFHTRRTNEIEGTMIYEMQSLASTDSWHSMQGYTGNTRALNAFIISHEEGVIAEVVSKAK